MSDELKRRRFLVLSGPLRELCEQRLREWFKGIRLLAGYCQAKGGSGEFFLRRGYLGGMRPGKGDPPPGWYLPKRQKKGGPWWFVEPRGAAGKREEAEIKAFVRLAENSERWAWDDTLNKAVGLPTQYRRSAEDGRIIGGGIVGYVQHCTTKGGRDHMLLFPRAYGFDGDAQAEIDKVTVPEGCREISEAEWDLLDAQARVENEQREKAA